MNMKSHSDLLSTENEFDEFLKYCQRGRECTKIYVGMYNECIRRTYFFNLLFI